MLDIYFNEEYGKLCELVEPGDCTVFDMSTADGSVRNMFIKRPVPWLIDGVQYYDIVTPYGYGGPIITNSDDAAADRLVAVYEKRFSEYCRENGIIAEFIRYHPIYRNWEHFGSVYENAYSRHTVGTNLKSFDDPVQSEFSKSARKEYRRAVKAGVSCTVHPRPDDLSVFRRLYEETMERNNAGAMYYFPDEYYHLLTTVLRPYVLEIRAHYAGETIASEMYFMQGDCLHAHLLGSNEKLLELYGGSLIEATAAEWGKENGYRFIHHGGGRTSAEDDPLYTYKKKFGVNTKFDFYTGKRIWNGSIYDRLAAIKSEEGIANKDFFPIYRG